VLPWSFAFRESVAVRGQLLRRDTASQLACVSGQWNTHQVFQFFVYLLKEEKPLFKADRS
jgi:hypothetical protein